MTSKLQTITAQDLESLRNGSHWPPEHCPACGHGGIPVTAQVMKAILDRDHDEHARDGFHFCPTPHCPLAYYDNTANTYVSKTETNKALTLKDPGRDVEVCYCLRVTRGTILDAIQDGSVQSSEDAKRVTKACTGKACHIVNPGGICCGDQLRDAVALGLALKGASQQAIDAALTEDPGATCCGRTLSKVRKGFLGDAACCAI